LGLFHLPFNFSLIEKQAKSIKAADFIDLVNNTVNLLHNESRQLGNPFITGRLVLIEPEGEALVIGDLHGDLTSLGAIIKDSNLIDRINKSNKIMVIFLGDYGDRGESQVELYYTVLRLKAAFPKQIVLLRGNHEGPSDLIASPHDLPEQLRRKFKDKSVPAYTCLVNLFNYLYNAVYVKDKYLMVHGGLPFSVCSLYQIAQANNLHPAKPFLTELLWSDPNDTVQGMIPSPRGVGHFFGKDVTAKILDRLKAKILIRGHESTPKGYKINHDGKVLTIFSSKGAPYFNTNGAYLNLPLNKKLDNANQLLPFIHTF